MKNTGGKPVSSRGGYWRCPACGSEESFEGTLHTAGPVEGVAMVREIGGIPFAVGQTIPGKRREITVRKCKNCKEVLGAKDYVKSAEEIAMEERERVTQRKAKENATGILAVVAVIVVTIVALFALIFVAVKIKKWANTPY